ncbi:MAG: pentapeptide repeat-containing protein [Aphanothece sp. CMT-3BRIN-NPC111]|jgi:uncharacterized protein YjbI with pentapeptide repeats|nr:pentapeptide repeat-containing protein [Aphanothece sp. CMT-3BRIN-NPC111]
MLTGTERLWPHNLSPNRLAVLERKLAIWLHSSPNLNPDQVSPSWQSDALAEVPTWKQLGDTGVDLSKLTKVIQGILDAKTENFSDLAKIAGLDLAVDFAGAKLLGTDLSGIELNGACLQGAYLRGASLSDADLSEASLSGANLAGADLSGALLSNADLNHTDLHRASLALANLSGANLSGANLTAANLNNANLSNANLSNANLTDADLHQTALILTNLTNVNLSAAKVSAAKFRDNEGLTAEIKQDLIERGAIFKDYLQDER